ncbi:MAG: DUF2169 domain-containing protein [Deltaproteobacteria bacterium]|nr:DUF2169 domain-containing protein [Deltaproteobacteria bacterium]
MRLVRDTPFEVGWLVWSLSPPRPSLTIVVKGTFTLVPDKPCEIAARQVGCSGDVHHDDEPDQSVRYESDFAVTKKRGECFVVGACHPPRGAPTPMATVAFAIGSVKKALAIYGDRHWIPKLLGHVPSEPTPFTRMPLRWERSFGGPGHTSNPVGVGIEDLEASDGPRRPLPNIEDPQALVTSMRDRPAPAGSFPIPRSWARRTRVAGTYDAAWQKTRWPWFPVDFDLAYFNAAPADQQIDGFWRGDEEITLSQLVPDRARLTTRLPGLAPRAFLDRGVDRFDEIRLHLDTITVDTDAGHVLCVWRGIAEVETESLVDVGHLFVAHESIYDERKPKSVYTSRLAAILEADRAEDAALAPEPIPDEPVEPEVSAPVIETDESRIPELVAAKEKLRSLGIDVDTELARPPPELPTTRLSEIREELRRRFVAAELDVPREIELIRDDDEPAAQGTSDPAAAADASSTAETIDETDGQARAARRRALVERRVAAKESLAFEDLSGADLHGLDLSGVDLRAALLAGANLRGARLDGATLVDAILVEADAEKASFVGASLGGADLSRVRAPHARFEKAVLDRADLSGADLEGATFVRASLVDATLHGARAARVTMDHADLGKLRASEGATFREASMQHCKARGSRWMSSDLGRANLSGSDLERADFTEASLVSAKLDECNLTAARFRDARMMGVSVLRSNAFEAVLEGADLTRADLRGSSLFGAQVWRARTEGALLDRADLGRTHLAR